MLRLVIFAVLINCGLPQQYQQKVAPGVPPQKYQEYQQPPPPPPPQYQQQHQQQQFQQPPQQFLQQVPVHQQQVPIQQQQQQQVPVHQQHPQGHVQHGDPQLLNPSNINQERDHIQEHMEVPIDTSKMSEQELQFHYFKMHDSDNNNMLDGCELIKSLIHWHDKIDTTYIAYTDEQLETITEKALEHTDINKDGYIDYLEFRLSNYKAKKGKEIKKQ